MLLSFFHTCASEQHHDLHDRESPMLSLLYTSGNFCIIELGLYIPMMGFLKIALGLHEQASSIMKNSHQYMKVIKQETLYHEEHGAILEAQVRKRIVALSLLTFSHIFIFFCLGLFLLFYSLFFYFCPEPHPDLWGNHSLHHPFLTWDNALIMMIITL